MHKLMHKAKNTEAGTSCPLPIARTGKLKDRK